MKRYLLGIWAALSVTMAAAAVNINTAGAEELAELPGIGPSKAAAIVAYRDENGAFKSVAELKNVKGIGDGILAKVREEAVTADNADNADKKAKPALKK
ncbi:ComEA family DNA-binding protein [Neisseria zalophi]|uniref:Helix-hairpin-helix domain-containing protein n=1 Tax=Neisseria zalophi TaxID=640030 RepID=A0A5J6PRJ6_9NEIS|nr:helix-hairpin-helix domain-containing protein [Neisseria zalophi]QEY25114.1 helix-hairpin-helix domain-containing protein [Neisseria zalophi]QEY25219.1 helix-hairpin-helix domain-containing protein [Neisseria zalophi]